MKDFIKILFTMALFTVVIFFSPQDIFAKGYSPEIVANDVNAKITISNKKLTNKPVTITIDASNYNNGNSYLYKTANGELIRDNKITMNVTENGYYSFIVVDKSAEMDPSSFYINSKFVEIKINNIDREKPTIKYLRSKLEQGTGKYEVVIDTSDKISGIATIILPNGEKHTFEDDMLNLPSSEIGYTTGAQTQLTVGKNGKYKVTAIDFAGNTTTTYITVKDYKKIPLSVNKIKSSSSYLTGKSVKNTWISVYKSNKRIAHVKTDGKGYFKAKIGKQKVGTKLEVWTWHIPEKYVSVSKYVKVVKK
ncbi:hypothetical protein [Bacillus massilinigeriensis]|uniref:hypothetical protein n=1 Tax=Bacillus massilionigeriensis TaxID=1805475 RepID=UPI00096AF99C|nr:hypothetical protein [Bacillus massilionigeriensis]